MFKPHLTKLASMLPNHKENYPGEHAELFSMTNTEGCDINEHVPTLLSYGLKVSTITEMGVRFGWSTRSFLAAKPKSLLSIDKFEWNSVHQSGMIQSPGNSCYKKYKELYQGLVNYHYLLGDTLQIDPIDPVELLFIDTFHHRDALKVELERHGNQAQKFIILHDTSTFGEVGQACDAKLFVPWVATNEPGTGLWYAIKPWLIKNPHWQLKEVFHNNNGLTILERQ